VRPEWRPPTQLRDPLVNRVAVPRYVWLEAIKERLPGLAEYAIGRGLAEHGGRDGGSCFPGNALLARENRTTEKSVKKALAWLLEHGWIRLEARGARKLGQANRYQLTMPAPLAVAWGWRPDGAEDGAPLTPWWTESDGPQWSERPEGDDPRHGSRAPVDPVEVPARHRATPVSRAPLESSRAPLELSRAPLGRSRGSRGAPTHPYPPSTHPPRGDQRAPARTATEPPTANRPDEQPAERQDDTTRSAPPPPSVLDRLRRTAPASADSEPPPEPIDLDAMRRALAEIDRQHGRRSRFATAGSTAGNAAAAPDPRSAS
jgi:hypothetical protein